MIYLHAIYLNLKLTLQRKNERSIDTHSHKMCISTTITTMKIRSLPCFAYHRRIQNRNVNKNQRHCDLSQLKKKQHILISSHTHGIYVCVLPLASVFISLFLMFIFHCFNSCASAMNNINFDLENPNETHTHTIAEIKIKAQKKCARHQKR